MTTCAPSLFTALINTEMGAWNTVESALSEAGNALTLGRFLVLRTVRVGRSAGRPGAARGGGGGARASPWERPRASWIASTETGSCTAPRVSTTGAQ